MMKSNNKSIYGALAVLAALAVFPLIVPIRITCIWSRRS